MLMKCPEFSMSIILVCVLKEKDTATLITLLYPATMALIYLQPVPMANESVYNANDMILL